MRGGQRALGIEVEYSGPGGGAPWSTTMFISRTLTAPAGGGPYLEGFELTLPHAIVRARGDEARSAVIELCQILGVELLTRDPFAT